jgi:hypothetical protein
MQSSGLATTTFLPFFSNTETGQTEIQVPQEVHFL